MTFEPKITTGVGGHNLDPKQTDTQDTCHPSLRVTAVILTKNEERHIARCIKAVSPYVERILVVDSGSSDRTQEIARDLGAQVLVNPWINYATQFNWGIEHTPADTDWILRLDADEIVGTELGDEIQNKLPLIDSNVRGIYVSRRMMFMGKSIRWGGVFPIRVIRLFRRDNGRCENRWMDEHIRVDGQTAEFKGEIIDNNTNSLTWWTEKHNSYASREVVDLLNLKYGFMPLETVAELKAGQHAGVKRWLKENIYANLPIGSRAVVYFLYRYVFRLGFLDGREGAAFHILQGFWYRYLVDLKLYQVSQYMQTNNVDVTVAIHDVLDIDLAL